MKSVQLMIKIFINMLGSIEENGLCGITGIAVVVLCLFKESFWLLESERGHGSLQGRGEAVPAAWLCQTILALGWGDSPRPLI